jgi:hypothetical protein
MKEKVQNPEPVAEPEPIEMPVASTNANNKTKESSYSILEKEFHSFVEQKKKEGRYENHFTPLLFSYFQKEVFKTIPQSKDECAKHIVSVWKKIYGE